MFADAQVNLSNGLMAYYPFTGNAVDSSGYGNNGSVIGATLTTDRFGKANSAYNFNSGDYIISNPNLPIDNSPRSVSVWFQTTSLSYDTITGRGANSIMTYGTGYAGPKIASTQINCETQQGFLFLNTYGTGLSGKKYVSDGQWHNEIYTFNGLHHNLYLDGKLIDSNNYTINTAITSLYFGQRASLLGYHPFVGKVDDARIYNRALNYEEVKALYGDYLTPSISNFTPNTSCPGTSTPILITGSNFMSASAVAIGSTSVDSFKVNSATSITAFVSHGTSGHLIVTTANGIATSDSIFTFGKGDTAYAYIANEYGATVSVINTITNKVVTTIPVGISPLGIGVSLDGTRVYVGNKVSNTVSVINTSTNSVAATVAVGNWPYAVGVSPNGAQVYVANYNDATISVINTNTNKVATTIAVGVNPAGVSFSADGTKAYISNFGSGTVSVINTTTNTVVATINVGSGPIGVTISPDGTKVFVANNVGGTVGVINASTNTLIGSLNLGNSPTGITITPDGTKVYVTNFGGGSVSVINASTNLVIATVPVGSSPYGISISPDGKDAYVSNFGSNSVSIINTSTNQVTSTVAVGSNPISLGNFIANVQTPCSAPPPPSITSFTPNTTCPSVRTPVLIKGANFIGTTAVAIGSTSVDSFKVNSATSITAFVSHGTSGHLIVTTANGTAKSDSIFIFGKGDTAYAYIANEYGATVSVINTITNKVVTTIPVGISPLGVGVSLDGTRVYVGNKVSNTVSVINTATNTVAATVAVGNWPYAVGVSPIGAQVYVANYNDATISVINTSTNKVASTIAVGVNPAGVSFSADGTKAYISNFGSGTVSVINTTTNTVVATINVGSGPIGVTISPDGTKVFVANNVGGTVGVINASANTLIGSLNLGNSPTGITITPDGTKVYVTNFGGGSVSVINASTNLVIATVPVGSSPYGISISPDGKDAYVSNFGNNSVSVINTSTNQVTSTIAVGSNPISLGNFIANIQSPCSILPITLQSFTVISISPRYNSVQIVTNNETNTAAIEIERSFDGTNFSMIDSLSAKGNSGANQYSIADKVVTSATVAYYRLKLINLDGSYFYSNIISIQSSSINAQLSIYPNPTKNFIMVNGKDVSRVNIIDNEGRVVCNKKGLNIASSLNKIEFNIKQGVYVVQILMTDGKILNKKLLVE